MSVYMRSVVCARAPGARSWGVDFKAVLGVSGWVWVVSSRVLVVVLGTLVQAVND